mgnify:CR=1 FL=1
MLRRLFLVAILSLFLAPFANAASPVAYDDAAFKAAQGAGKSILVQIHADWCPQCAAQRPIIANLIKTDKFKDLGAITHVGQDEFVAGQGAGLKFKEAGAKHVLCLIQEANNIGLQERCDGAKDTFGKVTNLTDYGAFVEVEQGIEGLVHVSEMDWTNKNVHPSKVVQLGDEVEFTDDGLDVDPDYVDAALNEWDACATEEALLLRERLGGEVVLATVGDAKAVAVLEADVDATRANPHRILMLGGAVPSYFQNRRWLVEVGRNGKGARTAALAINNVRTSEVEDM